MDVLIAFERSGIVRDAFIEQGHNAVSCDLAPTENPGPHIQADARPILREQWDLIIAHPPCQRLTRLNDLHRNNRKRIGFWTEFRDAVELFNECLEGNAPQIAVENPIMWKYAVRIIGRPDMVVQPYYFGDGYTKKTGFWVRNLPPLIATLIHPNPVSLIGGVKGKDRVPGLVKDRGRDQRKIDRSRFHPGMARAMAQQWGSFNV